MRVRLCGGSQDGEVTATPGRKHVFDRGMVHARYEDSHRTAESAIFQGLPIFLSYHGSACNRLKPIPQQGPVPHHAQNRRFRRGVAQNPRLVSHFGTKDSTSQSDQQTRPIPSRWREVHAAPEGGQTQNGCTDETQDHTIARYAGALRALQSRTACGRQRGQEPSLTASRSENRART